jgi:hypothetical protein
MDLSQIPDELKKIWDYLQDLLDVKGDVVLLAFTGAMIYKILYGGVTGPDCTAYSVCVSCFAVSKCYNGRDK